MKKIIYLNFPLNIIKKLIIFYSARLGVACRGLAPPKPAKP